MPSAASSVSFSDDLFFFNQLDPRKKQPRQKKQLDEQTLNNLSKRISSKFQVSDAEQQFGFKRSLTDRLADLYTTNSGPGTNSNGSPNSSASGSRTSTASYSPQAFTDTRLQAIRFLTEDMIKELEECLMQYIEEQIQPILPGPIIYELHNDWADLTDGVEYRNFPIWQTRAAIDSTNKRSSMTVHKNNMSRISHGSVVSSNKDEIKIKKSNARQLSIISEVKSKIINTEQSNSNNNNNNNNNSKNARSNSVSRKNSMPTAIVQAKIIANRMVENLSYSSGGIGCSVNYQLSNNHFKDKGWTVMAPTREDQLIDIERKIIHYLKTTVQNIDELHKFNEKYGLNIKCKIKYYGQYRKDQLEKYKLNSNLKPKKSPFAMSILRLEIPKPLDTSFLIESVSNPYFNLIARNIKSAYPAETINNKKLSINTNNQMNAAQLSIQTSLGFNLNDIPKEMPALLNTQTNDGTTCVYYPNGNKAILIANVYGYYAEASSSVSSHHKEPSSNTTTTTTTANTNIQVNPLTSMSGSFSSSNQANSGAILNAQNVKNSYTTIIYEYVSDVVRKSSKYSFKSLLSNSTYMSLNPKETEDSNNNNEKKVTIKSNRHSLDNESRVLCFITPTGNCVKYQSNGQPKFICSEYGGCLCTKKGAAYFQWKWEDIRQTEYDIIKKELFTDLNDFIRLEYKNPNNIKLKFICEKEMLTFDLGIIKENQNKISDFFHRTASDIPLKSHLGQLKINFTAKASAIMSYKQQHLQQQHNQHHQNNEAKKTSALNQSASSHGSKIDRLLESTVSYRDVPVMKDLLVIQKRIRSILEEWLIYCRNSLGVLNPNMYIFPDFPIKHKTSRLNENHKDFNKIILHKRKSRSVLDMVTSTPLSMNTSTLTMSTRNNKHVMMAPSDMMRSPSLNDFGELHRSKSAYITRKTTKLSKQHMDLIERIKDFKNQITKTNVYSTKLKKKHEKVLSQLVGPLNTTTSQSGMQRNNTILMFKSNPTPTTNTTQRMHTLNDLINKRKNFLKSDQITMYNNTTITHRSDQSDDAYLKRNLTFENLNMLCPASLHFKIGFDRHDIECRCRKHFVPFVNDIEYDALIKLLPSEQLAVVCVVDSFIAPTPTQKTIETMFINQNKNRIQPCKESTKDDVRFLFYDLRTCIDDSDHTQPMLVSRHNVSAGMVLIYKSSKLLFCDHIFNGYGYSQQDFLKQIKKCKEDATLGKSLPYNFRFTYSTGKFSKRTPWGGNIIGQPLESNSPNNEIIPFQASSTFRSTDSLVPHSLANNSTTNENDRLHLPKINKLITS